MIDHQIAILDAFKQADQVLMQGVSGITDLITTPGLINLDFADVKAVMSNAGSALMGIGSARGEDRARAAAEMAVSSPLLEASIDGAHGVLLSIAGGSDLGLFEVSAAAEPDPERGARGRQHHLRHRDRRRPRRRGPGHRHRGRLRGRPAAAPAARRQPRADLRHGAAQARPSRRRPGRPAPDRRRPDSAPAAGPAPAPLEGGPQAGAPAAPGSGHAPQPQPPAAAAQPPADDDDLDIPTS